MVPYRILLAEDHALFREGIKRILETDPALQVTAEVADGLELLEFLKTSAPDLILLDVTMPHLGGLEALKEIKARYPEVKVLILTMHKSRGHLLMALSAGADGYLLKGNAYDDLFAAIEAIRHGSCYISSLISHQIVELFREKPGDSLPERILSHRERQVLALLAQGKTSKEIAKHLDLCLATIQKHRANLKKKLNVKTVADLIKYALEKGVISSDFKFLP